MRLLYSAVLYLLLPVLLLRLLWRSLRQPGYRHNLAERFGWARPGVDARPLVWVHAVSVGEVAAVVPLVERLLRDCAQHRVLVTTSTPTGREHLRQRLGDRVEVAYAPWDLPGAVTRFLARTCPALLLLVETELWPNTLYHCERAAVPVILVNARLSARSAAGYRRAGRLARDMVRRLDHIACQGEDDAARFAALGVSKQALTITGGLKWHGYLSDEARASAEAARVALGAPARLVVAACSVHPGEVGPVLEAFACLRSGFPDAVLLLAPRRVERCDAVAEQTARAGQRVARYSRNQWPDAAGGVLLIDTIGDLPALCGAARSAFVGGSLVPHGGQNPLEPARWGLPVACGPHVENFAAIVAKLQQAGALETVSGPQALGDWWLAMSKDEAEAARRGGAARSVVEANPGALEEVFALVVRRLAGSA